eukprot:7646691-Alexandrium_andersonii.AAC.1
MKIATRGIFAFKLHDRATDTSTDNNAVCKHSWEAQTQMHHKTNLHTYGDAGPVHAQRDRAGQPQKQIQRQQNHR